MFAHLSSDNKEFSYDYISSLIYIANVESSINMRNFERPMLRLVQVIDKLQSERIKRILSKLFDLFKSNTQYFMIVESVLELLLRLSLRSPLFC